MLKNNDFKIKTVLAGFAFCLTLLMSFFLHSSTQVSADQPSANASAGSADDPLITLSYINKVYTPMLSRAIDNAIADSLKAVNDKLNGLDSQTLNVADSSNGSNSTPDVSGSYIVLELKKGQRVRANSESLEVILRQGGTASVISQYKDQGIADLTSGTELLDGIALPVNHSLLIPRADGRGIYVTSSVAYVMVRGDYEIY